MQLFPHLRQRIWSDPVTATTVGELARDVDNALQSARTAIVNLVIQQVQLAVNQPPRFFSYSASAGNILLNAKLASVWMENDRITGDASITLANLADGMSGTIDTLNDNHAHTITIYTPGRTIRLTCGPPDGSANKANKIGYEAVTVNGVPYADLMISQPA